MSTIRNFLICVGLLLLSGWLAILFFPISHLTDGISHDENVIGAIATGFLDSLPQLFATAIAGVCITLTAIGRKPERWAFIIAILYVASHLATSRWSVPPTGWWMRTYQWAALLSPAIACVAVAIITGRFRHKTTTAP
jgi:hypothetical protein